MNKKTWESALTNKDTTQICYTNIKKQIKNRTLVFFVKKKLN